MRLPDFAQRFAARGLAALVFDYRCFGSSDGEPRNLIDPRRHVEDWHAAIGHVRSLPQVDASRLAQRSRFRWGLRRCRMRPGGINPASQIGICLSLWASVTISRIASIMDHRPGVRFIGFLP